MAASDSAKTCFGALLTSAVFMLQASCVFFPVLGTLFGGACVVFVAVSAVLLKRRAVLVYLSVGFLMLAVSPRYALEFLMTTGPAGLTLGLLMDKGSVLSVLVSGLGMFAGLCGLTYLLGTAAFGSLGAGLSMTAAWPVYAIFSAVYPVVGLYILKRFIKKQGFMVFF